MKEDKKKKSHKKWMYLFVAAVVCVLIGAHFYVHYIRDCLMSQTISNVETVTHQQQQAFDSFVRRDRERIHSYADDFSRHDSGDQQSIRSKLDVFAEVDALYTVVNLETGEYYNSKSQEVHRMKEAELEEYRKFSGSGLREPYTGLFTDTKMFGYYECFTFADGARGLFQKGYESDRVSEEFTLSFYGGQGYAYIINRQGDVLMRPFVREEDGVGDNIFEMLDDDGKNGEKAAFLKEELGRNESGSVLFHDQEKEYVYTYTPIESVDGWYLMSIVSEGAIMDEADRVISNSQIIIVIALTIMVTLTVFLFFMWRVRRDLLQKEKEKEYKEHLGSEYGIVFNNLFTITNNPIGRFGAFLMRSGNMEGYLTKLYGAFNPGALPGMMCRSQLSVGWDGKLYDCDFNQAVDMPVITGENIKDLPGKQYKKRKICFDKHCYACTAGQGSSCGGSTA